MRIQVVPFAKLYQMDYSILRVVPFYHRWHDGNTFTTPEGGRPNSGLMYFSACETDYSIRDMPPFSAGYGDISYVPQTADYTCRFKNCSLNYQRCNEYLINYELFDETGQPFALAGQVQIIRPRDHIWYARRFEEVLHLFHHSSAPKGQIKALVYSILTDLSLEQRKEHLTAGKYAQIAPGLLYLEKHYRENPAIADLAELCHISESSFRRLFRAYTGLAPQDYAARLRIGKARLLLESGAMSVAEAAEAVGYQDSSYFSRVFKLKTGILPKDVLKNGV